MHKYYASRKKKGCNKMAVTINTVYQSFNRSYGMDIYLPSGEIRSAFLYFHGGGLEKGDKSSAAFFAQYLTERNVAVFSANYTLYPDGCYPDFIRDAAYAVSMVKSYISEKLRADIPLYIGGSSAGGYLSMMLCFDKSYLSEVGLDNSYVAGYLHDAGQPTAHYNVLKHSGIDKRRIIVDESAPLYHVGFEDKYPRMRFIVSNNDMKNRYEQTMLILSTLSHFGYDGYDCRVMQGKHCEYCKKYDENGDSIFGKIIFDFICGT